MRDQLEASVEEFARFFAAEKMNLQKDPHGLKLPEELWKQEIKNARRFLNLE